MGLPSDGEDDDTKARLNDLSNALDARRLGVASKPETSGSSSPAGMGQAVNLGFRVMTEFVASILVAGVIGWTIDHWLGSSPAALIVFIALGTGAGFWNVYRIAAKPTGPRGGSS